MVDYTKLITTTQRLISASGRSVTLVEFDSTLADPNKPWNGATDPRTAPDSTLDVDAVFVEPQSALRLGLLFLTDDLLKRAEQIMLISPGAAVDLSIFNEVIDSDSSRWKIIDSRILKPGDDVVLTYLTVIR